jgi:hypothetical protein
MYGLDPILINFFPGILERLKNAHELDVIEVIVYADFDLLPPRHQTYLRQHGISTRHRNEKNGGLNLVIEAMGILYKSPFIDVFVIITGTNELISLFSAIREKNKFVYCITLKENFDPMIRACSNRIEYLEDIFNFVPQVNGANA